MRSKSDFFYITLAFICTTWIGYVITVAKALATTPIKKMRPGSRSLFHNSTRLLSSS